MSEEPETTEEEGGAGFFTGPGHTVEALAARLRAGEVTSVELTEHSLRTVRRLDGQLNAFVTLDPGGALRAARIADAELATGRDRGRLHGIPAAVKDVVDTAGLRTTMGSAHFAGHVPSSDAECVRRLRAAGAVVVGKTTTHEFAYGPTGDRSLNGASRNPHDPTRMSGGSSGGSAVAVAAGMVPMALGTDTGGSVRIPAALCGVAGFKPAYGDIPTDGVFPLAPSLDHVGVLARTPRDCLLAHRALTESPPEPGVHHRTAHVGWLPPEGLFPTDPDVGRLVRACLAAIGATAAVEDVAFGEASEMNEAFFAIQDREAYAVHAERMATSPGLFGSEVLDRLRGAARTTARRHERALAARERIGRSVNRLLAHHDVLALPTTPLTAPRLGQRTAVVGGERVGVRSALLALTSPWNLLGLPALTVPAATVGGLPAGLQMICRPGREDLMFAVAQAVSGRP
ncbi:amidase [Streptomyces sp. WMMB 322]|uniref:amidase n=1 Tax=Streptomyces sp. WMMB 322 TaxID=1286821 RepID=UPI0006E1AD07|nr:amidase [Streptomyces sp. WMMB 322]SCK40149.1 aspartyl-tRNA(Asn)/glutamyl-tRNA(Gln) amidotransferase subunit A [Streptomyces sp. WMMB 322]